VFIGIYSEIQWERLWVEGKGKITRFYTCGWDGEIQKATTYIIICAS
jgi:hypothetical protein